MVSVGDVLTEPKKMGWTTCKCGHIAQDHNQGRDAEGNRVTTGPVSGNEPGRFTLRDIDAVPNWGCDVEGCGCRNYDGKRVGD
jgi:hypothetical protein